MSEEFTPVESVKIVPVELEEATVNAILNDKYIRANLPSEFLDNADEGFFHFFSPLPDGTVLFAHDKRGDPEETETIKFNSITAISIKAGIRKERDGCYYYYANSNYRRKISDHHCDGL